MVIVTFFLINSHTHAIHGFLISIDFPLYAEVYGQSFPFIEVVEFLLTFMKNFEWPDSFLTTLYLHALLVQMTWLFYSGLVLGRCYLFWLI